MRRMLSTLAVLGVVAAACSTGPDPSSTDAEPTDGSSIAEDDGETTAPDPPEGADDPLADAVRTQSFGCIEGSFHWEHETCQPATLIELDEIVSGGPPPDGIPPIDDPVFESVETASAWLTDESPVMVVDVDDDVRAYPLAILTFHEIVNDTVGGVPLVVTYCPLCNSALVFDRRIDGPDGEELLDFGTSGRLYLSNLVMYDRQHRNLWTQFEGQGVVGERFLGEKLDRVPAWLFGFGELAELHPDAQVLSRDTGVDRPYGSNPYVGYDTEGRAPFLFRGEIDDRESAMARMVGLADGDDAVAVLLELLVDVRAVTVDVADRPIAVVWAPGQSSALDAAAIDDGRDVGQTAAFVAELEGEPIDLEPTAVDGRFRDAHSGSTFDLRGRALDGPLEGSRLDAVPHDDTFWFVWAAFKPDTEVVAS